MTVLLSASECWYLCFNGFLFSVLPEVEVLGQAYRRFIQLEAVNSSPKIQNVSIEGTDGLEALAGRKKGSGVFILTSPRALLILSSCHADCDLPLAVTCITFSTERLDDRGFSRNRKITLRSNVS